MTDIRNDDTHNKPVGPIFYWPYYELVGYGPYVQCEGLYVTLVRLISITLSELSDMCQLTQPFRKSELTSELF